MTDFATARRNMIDGQLRPNRVNVPAVLNAFADVPRERFLNRSLQGHAYVDEDLAIGNGRYLEEPVIFARLLQACATGPDDTVLDVGCATGYSTAVIARVAGAVVGIDADAGFIEKANAALLALSIDNAVCFANDPTMGWPKQAPYDVIIIHGAVAILPDGLKRQLAEGGRLAAVVRDDNDVGRVTLMQKIGGVLSSRVLFDAHCPMLPGFERPTEFVF